jgi:hypothetical protein
MPSTPTALIATEQTPAATEPFQRLWAAVIETQIRDALRTKRDQSWGFMVAKRNSALHWLMKNNRDFITVCDLAGLEPGVVRAWARKKLQPPIDADKFNA